MVYVPGLLANLILLPIALAALPISIYVVQALFMTGVVVASYLAHKYYSFGGNDTGTSEHPHLRSHSDHQGLTDARRRKGWRRALMTILTPCYNEEDNVREVYGQVKAVMATVPRWDYDHLFIDNASTDRTVPILRDLAAADQRVKVIVNTRNFGQIRSPYHALLEARGDAVIDMRRGPAGPLSSSRVRGKWEKATRSYRGQERQPGVVGHRPHAHASTTGSWRKLSSDVELVHNFTGFGLYDREVSKLFRGTDEQYPYSRGL